MLILTRREDEKIFIGHDIKIMITDISGSIVKLGIDAPEDVPIAREEVYKEIKQENKASSKPEFDYESVELDI